jgi:carbamoyltransferase
MGFIPLSSEATTETYRRNLACSLQQRMETVVLELAESIRQRLQIDSLCLAGGVCLNSLLVARLERESGFRQVFVQPAAGNAGCSVGGPLYLWHKRSDTSQTEPWQHVFLGPEYSDDDVKSVLDNCKLPYRHINTADKLVSVVAELLSQGKIVAWFQGRTEFGGRSLGARSILANPQQEYIQENLNVYIKHREVFRPFAASVPEELTYDYFEGCGPLSRFLLSVSHIRESQRHQMPGAWFANGLARVHTVSRDSNPLFWRLLHKFGEKAGVPILLNTSFNLFGEPLVCSPRDAVRSYSCSGIDALVIRQFLLEKWGDAAGVLS